MTFIRKSYISNLLKSRNYYLQKSSEYLLAFGKESKRKLLTLVSTDSFIKNDNLYDFLVEISFIHA